MKDFPSPVQNFQGVQHQCILSRWLSLEESLSYGLCAYNCFELIGMTWQHIQLIHDNYLHISLPSCCILKIWSFSQKILNLWRWGRAHGQLRCAKASKTWTQSLQEEVQFIMIIYRSAHKTELIIEGTKGFGVVTHEWQVLFEMQKLVVNHDLPLFRITTNERFKGSPNCWEVT